MRIFFCGAQGTGKSTLVYRLSHYFPNAEIYDSMSALFMKKKEEQFTESFQNKVNVYCFNIFLNSREDLIMSRSIIDSLAMNTKKKDLNFIESLILDSIRDDDYYFYLPIEFKISQREDGLRELDSKYQKKIDKKILRYFNEHPAKKKFIIKGTIEERLQQILKIIRNED